MKCLLFCCKAKPYLNCDYGVDGPEEYTGCWHIYTANKDYECSKAVNGTIVAECDIHEIEKVYYRDGTMEQAEYGMLGLRTKSFREDNLLEWSCMSYKQLKMYLNDKDGYALFLSNLKIFDKPKELGKHSLDNDSDFFVKRWDKKDKIWRAGALIRRPKNMHIVYNKVGEEYLLIPVKSDELCKILNGEKKIIVKKQILNCLKEVFINE